MPLNPKSSNHTAIGFSPFFTLEISHADFELTQRISSIASFQQNVSMCLQHLRNPLALIFYNTPDITPSLFQLYAYSPFP